MNKALVSICIPTYNSGAFVKRTLDSVLSQTYDNIEVIIVDDCSKDDTADIVKTYKDKRIHFYINEKNAGLTQNWNNSIEKASGKYIKLLCADDVIYDNCIEEEVKALESNPSVSLVISKTHIVNSMDKVTLNVRKLHKEGVYDGKKLAKKSILFRNYYGAPCSTMFRKETIDRIGAFDNELKHIPDYDLWLRLSYEGDVYFIDKYLSAFRVHNFSNTNNLISGRQKEFTDEHRFMVMKHMKYEKIKISETDLKIHTAMRNLRNFMLAVFIKYFNN